jgi:type IV secretion system protein VirB5
MKQKQNPYLGQRKYLDAHARYVLAARQWRWVAILALIIAAFSTTGLVVMGMQSQLVPYVVKVDRLGQPLAVGRADRAGKPDRTVIVAQLARWITAARSVWVDAGAQRGLIKEAYAMINAHADAYGVLNGYMRSHDPFKRAKTETVIVDVQSVLPISKDSWRIEWREETRSRDGTPTASRDYQATVTLAFNPPRDEATIRLNPMGLYINSFNWAERLGPKGGSQ